jgi:hypothetical protein
MRPGRIVRGVQLLGMAVLAAGMLAAMTSCDEGQWGGWKGKGNPWPGPGAQGAPLQVTECALGSAPWVPGGTPANKPAFRIRFSKHVDFATVKVPQTVRIIVSGAKGAGLLPGATLYPSGDHKSLVLVSALTESQILFMLGATPNTFPAGSPVGYQILLLGVDDKGSGVIRDTTGHPLDGNSDGVPGGIYSSGLAAHLTWK